MNKLLITADDFGLHPLINEAIIRCAEKGTVNSISVMANAEYPDFNILKQLQQQQIFVGAHLLWLGCQWLTDNIFIADWKAFTIKLFTEGKDFRNKLKAEAQAQIELLIANGILPDHIDSHQHVHHFNAVWQLAEELASQYNIKRTRCCKVAKPSLAKRGLSGIIFNKIAAEHFNPAQHFYTVGIRHAGTYSITTIQRELSESSGVNTELILHPATSTNELKRIFPQWNFDWRREFDALMDDGLTGVISENKFYLHKRQAG